MSQKVLNLYFAVVLTSFLALVGLRDQTGELIDIKSWNSSSNTNPYSLRNGPQLFTSPFMEETVQATATSSPYYDFLRNDEERPPLNCTSRESVVYIKTHKTGSTTVQSIVYRYGLARNLSFVIRKANKLNGHIRYMAVYKDSPKKMFLPLLGEGSCSFHGYDLSAIHVVHNKPVFESFMKPGAKYITILRHPVSQLLSAFVFFHLGKNEKGDTTEMKLFNYIGSSHWKRSTYGRNSQSKDLGLKTVDFDDETKIKEFINRLDKELDLVLINEYFDESVVLMKRELCWSLEDVLYTIQNNRSNEKPKTSPKLSDKIRIFNHADFLLYEHFNKTFWKRVEEQGPSFGRDLEEFRRLQKEAMYKCFNSSTIPAGYVCGDDASDYCDRYAGGKFLFKTIYKQQSGTCTSST